MPRTRKKLKIKTVIHRARKYVNEGNKTEAINSVLCTTDYTPREAETLVEFIEYFLDVESDGQIVSRWCDEHRMSGFLCRDQHAPEEDPFFVAPAAPPATPVRRPNCTCGPAACDNKWHRLAMWIRDNPQEWFRLFEELEQRADED